MAWLKRIVPPLLVDALIAIAIVFPGACAYLRWPMLGTYALLSWALLRKLRQGVAPGALA